MDGARWEKALHETRGLGNWRRDIPVLAGVIAVTFGVLLLIEGEVGTSLVSALLVGFGVLVVLPLLELLGNYRRTPRTAAAEEDGPRRSEEEQERYESLRERLAGGRPPSRKGSGPE